jgi:excinuclease ABC subunit A
MPLPTAQPEPRLSVPDTAEATESIVIRGAREHNLQNIDLVLPRNELVVLTGVSGSGKSSIAFDTLYAEGQRRYLETFSGYLRQFIGGIQRPDVDKVDGLSPVIAIDQKTTARNPRSTVGTITEVYDFLRLLYARIGEAYSYHTGRKMESLTDSEILQRIRQRFDGQLVALLAPVVKGRKGLYREELNKLLKAGYGRARIDGQLTELVPDMALDRYRTHDIEAVVDQLSITDKNLARLTASVTTTLDLGKGSMQVLPLGSGGESAEAVWFCRLLMDPETGLSYDEPAPNSFSFNSPYGWCPTCTGLGTVVLPNLERIFPDPTAPLEKALAPVETFPEGSDELAKAVSKYLKKLKITPTDTFASLEGSEALQAFLYGRLEAGAVLPRPPYGWTNYLDFALYGFAGFIRLVYEHLAEGMRSWAEHYLAETTCPDCDGARLKKESLWFRVHDQNIHQLARLDLRTLDAWLTDLPTHLTDRQRLIAHELLKEIRGRVRFLLEVGLDYLNLDRPARTLSGGEAQRIRLATQIGSQLTGVLYILDEPSIGLHQRDNDRLIRSLRQLHGLGNSVLVVEHDKDMMLAADHLVEVGPAAGKHGGRIVAQGPPEVFRHLACPTADYLSGRRRIEVPTARRTPSHKTLTLVGATGHNLRSVDLTLPLGLFVVVSGVSGSGKSSLITQTLYPILHRHAFGFARPHLPYERVEGLEWIDKVIEIDQKPIGRTPRSNPATYTGLMNLLRELYAELPEAKIRGYKPGRFSFNVKGGRCEDCKGAGVKVIEMNFLPDVHVVCPTCRGRRYNRETLEVCYKGKSINDVLNMTVSEALRFFESLPRIRAKIQALQDVGLGYITLGQPATTLSGGEAQRMKIAAELSKRDTGRTFYILDEPTTGLHFQDIELLLRVLNRLVERGNTILVIEHNLDVIKVADWVVDMGPEGGSGGGTIVVAGTPEDVAACEASHTGRFLKSELAATSPQPAPTT